MMNIYMMHSADMKIHLPLMSYVNWKSKPAYPYKVLIMLS